jgi:hypothetical protein
MMGAETPTTYTSPWIQPKAAVQGLQRHRYNGAPGHNVQRLRGVGSMQPRAKKRVDWSDDEDYEEEDYEFTEETKRYDHEDRGGVSSANIISSGRRRGGRYCFLGFLLFNRSRVTYAEENSESEEFPTPVRRTSTSSGLRKRKREEDDFGGEEPKPTKFTLQSYLQEQAPRARKLSSFLVDEEDKASASVSASSSSDSDSSSEEIDNATKLRKLMQQCESKTEELKQILAKNNLQYEVCFNFCPHCFLFILTGFLTGIPRN